MYLREIRERRKITQQELADKIGTTKSNISLIENEKIKLSVDKAEKIAEILEVKVSDIFGQTQFNPDARLTKMIPIKYFDISASAGNGCFVNNENFEIINIDEIQLKKMGIRDNFKNIVVVNVKGDSMLPTLEDGDLLFIDTTKKEIYNKKIYVITEDNYLKVKRILKNSPDSKEIIIKSDNEIDGEYPPYPKQLDNLSENFICGQVIFYCRSIE